ncbi:MAG: hypothetical protein WCJ49_07720, partial [Deltaproteobacteria bacterium]
NNILSCDGVYAKCGNIPVVKMRESNSQKWIGYIRKKQIYSLLMPSLAPSFLIFNNQKESY